MKQVRAKAKRTDYRTFRTGRTNIVGYAPTPGGATAGEKKNGPRQIDRGRSTSSEMPHFAGVERKGDHTRAFYRTLCPNQPKSQHLLRNIYRSARSDCFHVSGPAYQARSSTQRYGSKYLPDRRILILPEASRISRCRVDISDVLG
jgi:hypothetical protein